MYDVVNNRKIARYDKEKIEKTGRKSIMREGILVHKKVDFDDYYYEEGDGFYPEGWIFGKDGYGEKWFSGWHDVIIGEESTRLENGDWVLTQKMYDDYIEQLKGIFDDNDDFVKNFDEVLDCGIETKATNWEEFIKECLEGDYRLVVITK